MLKENGMLAPTDKKEIANSKLFVYVCKTCNAKKQFNNRVFGETRVCDCGGELIVLPIDRDDIGQ